jgi:hypothetical protein
MHDCGRFGFCTELLTAQNLSKVTEFANTGNIMLHIMLSMKSKLEINQLRVEIPPDLHFGTGSPPSESPRQFNAIIYVWDAPTEKEISEYIEYGDTCRSNYCLTKKSQGIPPT